MQNFNIYPNPSKNNFNIEITSDKDLSVDMSIFDVRGNLIKTFVPLKIQSGVTRFEWNGRDDNNSDLSAGTYILMLKSGNSFKTLRIVINK